MTTEMEKKTLRQLHLPTSRCGNSARLIGRGQGDDYSPTQIPFVFSGDALPEARGYHQLVGHLGVELQVLGH